MDLIVRRLPPTPTTLPITVAIYETNTVMCQCHSDTLSRLASLASLIFSRQAAPWPAIPVSHSCGSFSSFFWLGQSLGYVTVLEDIVDSVCFLLRSSTTRSRERSIERRRYRPLGVGIGSPIDSPQRSNWMLLIDRSTRVAYSQSTNLPSFTHSPSTAQVRIGSVDLLTAL